MLMLPNSALFAIMVRCIILRHIATHCNALQRTATNRRGPHICYADAALFGALCYYGTLQHTATHCNTLQHTNALC